MGKKSYMDRKNLIAEGFFSKFKKMLIKKLTALEKVTNNKQVAKDPRVKAAWTDLEKHLDQSLERTKAMYKKHGWEYPPKWN
tara:strand:+ start:3918 stop:4163 length:246 start_codon:yes stop_codon:yes gene_type:complete